MRYTRLLLVLFLALTTFPYLSGCLFGPPAANKGSVVVLGYNDLGMHCMNEDFSELMILPPYNTLHAQVIERRSEEPRIVQSGVTVTYDIPGNTTSSDKTNFWEYVEDLFGVAVPVDVGLAGLGMSGTMVPSTRARCATPAGRTIVSNINSKKKRTKTTPKRGNRVPSRQTEHGRDARAPFVTYVWLRLCCAV